MLAAWLAACKAEAETGGVVDLELLELSPQLFSSMTRAGDFMSILGRAEENFLLVNSISRPGCEDGGKFDPPPTASFLSASRNSARFLCSSSSVDSNRR